MRTDANVSGNEAHKSTEGVPSHRDGIRELEILANDTEELMKAEPSDRGMQRALMSIVYRIRHAVKKIKSGEAT